MSLALCERAVAVAREAGASHVDVRASVVRRAVTAARDGALAEPADVELRRLTVYAFADGGTASVGTSSFDGSDIDDAARRAVDDARIDAILRRTPASAPERAVSGGSFSTPGARPAPSPGERAALVLDVDARLRCASLIVSTAAFVGIEIEDIWFVASDGLRFEQQLWRAGGGVSAWASDGVQTQLRSWPGGGDAGWGAGGWERIDALDLLARAEPCARAAIDLLAAHECPTGSFTVIAGGDVLAHHLARGGGAALVDTRARGRSVRTDDGAPWTPADVTHVDVASRAVRWHVDPERSDGLGRRGWDDRGTPTAAYDMVRDGRLVALVGDASAAAPAVACGAAVVPPGASVPTVCPPNLSLAPGQRALAEMIADIEDGLLLQTYRAGAISPDRSRFAHRVESARRIRHGELVELVRDVVYYGDELPFWRGCVEVAAASEQAAWGVRYASTDPTAADALGSIICGPAAFEGVSVMPAARGAA